MCPSEYDGVDGFTLGRFLGITVAYITSRLFTSITEEIYPGGATNGHHQTHLSPRLYFQAKRIIMLFWEAPHIPLP